MTPYDQTELRHRNELKELIVEITRDHDTDTLDEVMDTYVDRIIAAEQRAAYDANRAVIREQKKYLEDMTLSDGKTVIKALPVGMMYACANHLAEPLEQSLRKEQE